MKEIKELLEEYAEKINKDGLQSLSKEESDVMTFGLTIQILYESLSDIDAIGDRLRCISKMNQIRNDFIANYPKYKEIADSYLKPKLNGDQK